MFLLTLQSLHFSDMIEATFLHILQRAFALPALGFYHYHYSKAIFPMFVTLFGIFILVSDLHPIKA